MNCVYRMARRDLNWWRLGHIQCHARAACAIIIILLLGGADVNRICRYKQRIKMVRGMVVGQQQQEEEEQVVGQQVVVVVVVVVKEERWWYMR